MPTAEQKQKDLEFFAQIKNLPKMALPVPGYELFDVNTRFSTSKTLLSSYATFTIKSLKNKQVALKHCLTLCNLVQGCFGVNYQEAKKDEEEWDECTGVAELSSAGTSAVEIAKSLGKGEKQGLR